MSSDDGPQASRLGAFVMPADNDEPRVPTPAPMTAHARPMPAPAAPASPPPAPAPVLDDQARTERLLEQQAAADLERHRAQQAAGALGTITSRIARGAW